MLQQKGKATYRYAVDVNHHLVDVESLNKEHRHDSKYYCISCGDEVLPVMGELREWHFRHVRNKVCNGETYIHKLSKKLFFERFNSSDSLCIPVKVKQKCKLLKGCSMNVPKNECWLVKKDQYDLKKAYDKIAVEKGIAGFVADILLEDSSGVNKPFLIEFCVSHKCESLKLNSGYPIFEMPISSEDDAIALLHEKVLNGNVYNLNLPMGITDMPLNRKFIVSEFVIFRSGKTDSRLYFEKQCLNLYVPNHEEAVLEFFVIGRITDMDEYAGFLVSAIDMGFKVKDCRLCQFYKDYKTSHYNGGQKHCCLWRENGIPKFSDYRCAYGCPYYTMQAKIKKIAKRAYVTISKKESFNELDFRSIYSEQKAEVQRMKEEQIKKSHEIELSRKRIKSKVLSFFEDRFNNATILLSYRDSENASVVNWRVQKRIPYGFLIDDLKNYYNKCKKHDDNKGRFCLELFNDAQKDCAHLYIVFLLANEHKPSLKEANVIAVFVWINDMTSICNMVDDEGRLLIVEVKDADFTNFDYYLEHVKGRQLPSLFR